MVSKTKKKGSGSKGKDGQRNRNAQYKEHKKENKLNNEQQQHFWQNEQIDQISPQERVAKVKSFWKQLPPSERIDMLTIEIDALKKRAIEVMKRNHQELEQVVGQGDTLLSLEIEHYPELLETGLKRLRNKSTWKQWKWNIHGGQEFTDMEAFKTYVEENYVPTELCASLSRDDSKYETPEETALRKRMQELLAKVHNATKQFQDELQASNQSQRKNRNNNTGGTTKDNSAIICEKNIEFITIMLTELSKEHELLHRLVLVPLLDYIIDAVPENRRQSSMQELVYEDLEQLSAEEVSSICEWVLEKVDGLTAKWKIDPEDEQEEEEEEEGEDNQASMGDVDLFQLKKEESGAERLAVNPKWLKHLQERTLGEDGQPRKLSSAPDHSNEAGLVLEWVYGSIVSTAEKARDGAKRSLTGRPVDPLRAFKSLLTGLQEHRQWRERKGQRSELIQLLDKQIDSHNICEVLEQQFALVTAQLLHLSWLQNNQDEEVKLINTQIYQQNISMQRNQKLLESARATREALGPSGNAGGPNATLANQKLQESMEIQAVMNNSQVNIQQLVQKKMKIEKELTDRAMEMRTVRQRHDEASELQALLKACKDAISNEEQLAVSQMAIITSRSTFNLSSTDPRVVMKEVEEHFQTEWYPQVNSPESGGLQDMKVILKEEEDICHQKCLQLRAVLGHLEMQFLNIACDDPGSTIGMHIALPILQERLDSHAFKYAKKLAEEAQHEVLKLEEQEDNKQQESKKKKASKKAKVKEAQRVEREQQNAKKVAQEAEILKEVENAQKKQEEQERVEKQARQREIEARELQEYEAALEQRRLQILEEERAKQLKQLEAQKEQVRLEFEEHLRQKKQQQEDEVRMKEEAMCSVSSDSLSSEQEKRSMDGVLDSVQDQSWSIASAPKPETSKPEIDLEDLERSSSSNLSLPSLSNPARRNRSSSSAFSSCDSRPLPPVDEEVHLQQDIQPPHLQVESEKHIEHIEQAKESKIQDSKTQDVEVQQQQHGGGAGVQKQGGEVIQIFGGGDDIQRVQSPGYPIPPPQMMPPPHPGMFGPMPDGMLPPPPPHIMYPHEPFSMPPGMVPMPPLPMGNFPGGPPPPPYAMQWMPPPPGQFLAPPPPSPCGTAPPSQPLLTTRSGNVLLNPGAKEFIPRLFSVDNLPLDKNKINCDFGLQSYTSVQPDSVSPPVDLKFGELSNEVEIQSPVLPETVCDTGDNNKQIDKDVINNNIETITVNNIHVDSQELVSSFANGFPENLLLEKQPLPRGLSNDFGSSNCFVNAIVQSLWHLPTFRVAFLASSPTTADTHDSHAFNALLNLFQRMQKDHQDFDNVEKAISPVELRQAMSQMGDGFSTSDMHDASEALCELFSAMCRAQLPENSADPLLPVKSKLAKGEIGHSKGDPLPSVVAQQFGIPIQNVQSGGDGDENNCIDVEQYMKYFHLIPAQALRESSRQLMDGEFEEVLQWAEHIEKMNAKIKDDAVQLPPQPHLARCPNIFTIVLVWESAVAPSDAVRETVSAIQPSIQLSKLFQGVVQPSDYCLNCIVCYQRHHYNTFAYSLELSKWCLFDDEEVTVIGDYSRVQEKIKSEVWQPVMLFYGNTAVST